MKINKLKIVKIGGNVIENDVALASFLKDFSAINNAKILVHGGGKLASKLALKLGLQPVMIDGRRVTDKSNLDVAVMVYGGLVNKNIVAALQANNTNAIGLSGADANLIQSVKRPVKEIDYGFVGDIVKVNSNTLKLFIENNMTPVFCALTHDRGKQLLNTNADTIAAEIAISMSAYFEVELNYIFELKGVLKNIADKDSVIPHLNKTTYKKLVENNTISSGMLPKLKNSFDALQKGVFKVKIGATQTIKNNGAVCTTLSLK